MVLVYNVDGLSTHETLVWDTATLLAAMKGTVRRHSLACRRRSHGRDSRLGCWAVLGSCAG